jgi:hypothetical protein
MFSLGSEYSWGLIHTHKNKRLRMDYGSSRFAFWYLYLVFPGSKLPVPGKSSPDVAFDTSYISVDNVSDELKEVQKMEQLSILQKENAVKAKKMAKLDLERKRLEAEDRLAVALKQRAEVLQGHSMLENA